MIESHEYAYQQILSLYVKSLFCNNTEIDPAIVNRAKFYTKALYIANVFVNKELSNDPPLTIMEVADWFSVNISAESLFVKLIHSANTELIKLIDSYIKPIDTESIGVLYEKLLNIETSGVTVVNGKGLRNNLGSYYTPNNLAQALVVKTVDSYKGNLINAKVVDFSCGAGIFLTNALEYICSKIRVSDSYDIVALKKVVARNIYACDVDCIALEIAKLNVLKYVGDYTLYPELSGNFSHANFLVHSKENISDSERLEVVMTDMIYHKSLAINLSSLQRYDIILGNPPWEKIRFEEKVFFSQFTDRLTNINFKFDLPKAIEQTTSGSDNIRDYTLRYKLQLETIKADIKKNPFFNISNIGELNTCTLFANAAYNLLSENGVFGLIVKSSLLTTQVNKVFFNAIKHKICAVYDFINRRKIFNIDSRERFSLLIVDNHHKNSFLLGMNLESVDELEHNHIEVSIDELDYINPNTGMLPNVSSVRDFNLLLKLHKSAPMLPKSFDGLRFGRLVHLTNHISDIDTEQTDNNIPVYEGKFFNQFDGSYSGFNNSSLGDKLKSKATSVLLTDSQKERGETPLSRFFINKSKWAMLSKNYNAEYMLAWRSLTSATNTRSCIATILPFVPASQSVQFLTTEDNCSLLYLLGIFNSTVFDYIIKRKLSGIDLTQSILNQTPVPSLKQAKSINITIDGSDVSLGNVIIDICKSLLANDHRLHTLCSSSENYHNKTRFELICILDCAVAKLYNLSQEEFEYILTMFPKQYNASDIIKLKAYHTVFIQ